VIVRLTAHVSPVRGDALAVPDLCLKAAISQASFLGDHRMTVRRCSVIDPVCITAVFAPFTNNVYGVFGDRGINVVQPT